MSGADPGAVKAIFASCKRLDDWPLLMAAFLTKAQVQQLRDALLADGIFIASISGVDEDTLIAALAREFRFPDYFGENWNAVEDCLTDLSWLKAQHFCCIVSDAPTIATNLSPRVYALFVDALRDAAMTWRERGVVFKVVFA